MPDYPWTPHPALRGYVRSCVGYDHTTDPDAVHYGLPSLSGTVIIAFDDPLDVAFVDEPDANARYWLLAGGLHARPVLVRTHGVQRGIQVALTPLGARTLWGVPLGALAATVADHGDLPLGMPPSLHARLAAASDWPERFALLEAHLLARLARSDADLRPDLSEAWRVLVRSRGRVRVDALAGHVGWSRRTLTQRFASEFGLTPKQAARVARFEHARRLAEGGVRLADVAHHAGYADQAHLTREWTSLAARSPVATLSEAFPNVQDDPAARRAG